MSSENPSKTTLLEPQLSSADENETCCRCGGNGYTKSTPSCYQTCLDCLGRGFVIIKSFS